MSGYLSLEGLQHFWSKVKSYIDNKLSNTSNTEENKVYSTEEHIVGTWIDGRPVYEMVKEGRFGQYSSESIIKNLEVATVVSAECMLGFHTNENLDASGTVQSDSSYSGMYLFYSNFNKSFILKNTSNKSFFNIPYVAIIRYLK